MPLDLNETGRRLEEDHTGFKTLAPFNGGDFKAKGKTFGYNINTRHNTMEITHKRAKRVEGAVF